MTIPTPNFKKSASREAILFALLLLTGLVVLPVAIYTVGQSVFGDYGGTGIADFLKRIYRGILDGHGVIWFLVLSPYLGWQLLRLTIWLFRRTAPPRPTGSQ